MSGAAPTIAARPARTAAWSSSTATRIGAAVLRGGFGVSVASVSVGTAVMPPPFGPGPAAGRRRPRGRPPVSSTTGSSSGLGASAPSPEAGPDGSYGEPVIRRPLGLSRAVAVRLHSRGRRALPRTARRAPPNEKDRVAARSSAVASRPLRLREEPTTALGLVHDEAERRLLTRRQAAVRPVAS